LEDQPDAVIADGGLIRVPGIMFSARNLGDVPPRARKGLAEAIGKQQGSGVVALVSTAEGKASLVVAVSPGRPNQCGRSGARGLRGGRRQGWRSRPDLAQAGGLDGAKADEALAAVRAALG
jgi:alanyl-tRNA synthetase